MTNRFTFWASIRETVTKTGGGFHAICCNGLHQGPPARLRQAASTPNFKGSQRMTPLTRKLHPTPPHPTPPCPAPTADDALRHIPGLDVNAGLRRVLDKRPAYEGLLRKFVAGQAHAVQATRTALAAGQHDEAQRAMHTLKGTAGNIGATALAALAQRAEEAIAQKTSSSQPRRAPHRTTRSSGTPRRSPTATRRNGTAQATPRAWWATPSRCLRADGGGRRV